MQGCHKALLCKNTVIWEAQENKPPQKRGLPGPNTLAPSCWVQVDIGYTPPLRQQRCLSAGWHLQQHLPGSWQSLFPFLLSLKVIMSLISSGSFTITFCFLIIPPTSLSSALSLSTLQLRLLSMSSVTCWGFILIHHL